MPGKSWVTDDSFCVNLDEGMNAKFVYYALLNNEHKIVGKVRKAGMPRLGAEVVTGTVIPVPPLAVQEEIVRILDKMSALTQALTQALIQYTKQYCYYRDLLINMFHENGEPVKFLEPLLAAHGINTPADVEHKALGEIGKTVTGLTGKNKTHFSGGNARYVAYKNIFENIVTNLMPDDLVQVAPGERQNQLHRGDILITGSSETKDEVGMSSVVTTEPPEPLYLNSFCFAYRLNSDDELLPDYSKYLFRSTAMRKRIAKCSNGVTRINLSKPDFLRLNIPIPPEDVQAKIVEILDKFSALIDASTGIIPQLIAKTEQQLAYYRERLLDFPALAPSSSENSEVPA